MVHGQACAYGLPAVLRLIAPAVPDKVKTIGTILGESFTGDETSEKIGEKTAAAYAEFARSVGLPDAPVFGLDEERYFELADKIVNEPFAGLSPVNVDKAVALKLLKESLS